MNRTGIDRYVLTEQEIENASISCCDCGQSCDIDQLDFGGRTSVPCVVCSGCGFTDSVDAVENLPGHWYDPGLAELFEYEEALTTAQTAKSYGIPGAQALIEYLEMLVCEAKAHERSQQALVDLLADAEIGDEQPEEVLEVLAASTQTPPTSNAPYVTPTHTQNLADADDDPFSDVAALSRRRL